MKQKRALLAVGEQSVTLVGKIPIGEESLKVTSYPSNEFDDELIKEEAKKEANNNKKHSHIKLDYQDGIYYGFITGAEWMKKQILNQKKNKTSHCIGKWNIHMKTPSWWHVSHNRPTFCLFLSLGCSSDGTLYSPNRRRLIKLNPNLAFKIHSLWNRWVVGVPRNSSLH